MTAAILHAEYVHKPDEPGIKTVCGVDGAGTMRNLEQVNCPDCLDIMQKIRERQGHVSGRGWERTA